MPTLRLEDNELLDLFDSGGDDEFDALNPDEREWLGKLVTARDSGKALARHRWEQAKERVANPVPLPEVGPQQPKRLSQAPTGSFVQNIAKDLINIPAGMIDVASATAEGLMAGPAALAGYPGALEFGEDRGRELLNMGKGTLGFMKDTVVAGLKSQSPLLMHKNEATQFLDDYPVAGPLTALGMGKMAADAMGGAPPPQGPMTGGTTSPPPPPNPPLALPPHEAPPTQYASTMFEQAVMDINRSLEEGGVPGQAAIVKGKVSNRSTEGGGMHPHQALTAEFQLVRPDLTRAQIKDAVRLNRESVIRQVAFARTKAAVEGAQNTFANTKGGPSAQAAGSANPSIPINYPLREFDTKRLSEMREASKLVDQYYQRRRPEKVSALPREGQPKANTNKPPAQPPDKRADLGQREASKAFSEKAVGPPGEEAPVQPLAPAEADAAQAQGKPGPTLSMLGGQEIWERLQRYGAPAARTAIDHLADIGAEIADQVRGPVKGLKGAALLSSGEWANKFIAQAKAQGYDNLTQEQIAQVWNHSSTRLARTGYKGGIPTSGAAEPRGAWVAFAREAGPGQANTGLAIYNVVREINHRTHLMKRLVRETEAPLWKNVDPVAEADMMMTIAATPDPGSPGSWLRYGTMPKAEAKAYIAETGSHILPDGLILDDPRHSLEGTTQIYKLVKSDEAKSLMDKFVAEHPEGVPTLNTLMSQKEELAQLNQFGDSLPMHGFQHLRDQYKIVGLEESERLNNLGREIGVLGPEEKYPLGYVSELAQMGKPRSVYGRVRNFLSFATAAVRRRKSGGGLKQVWTKQAEAKLAEGHRLGREGLAVEDIFNDGVTSILTLALEPMDLATGPKPNYVPLTKHTFGESGRRWQRYVDRNQEVFDQMGAQLDEAPVEGKTRYQISRGLVDRLRPLFADDFVSTDPKTQALHDNLYKAMDGLVSSVNTARLTAPSTQIAQSAKANTLFFAVRVLRDAFKPMFSAVIGGEEGRLAAVHDALTQAVSTVAAIPASLRPSVRGRIPLEALGETSALDLTGGPPGLRKAQGRILTPMRAVDWVAKWANTEASIDGAARIAWNRAKRAGGLPKGADYNTWVKNWKSNVPAPVRALAAIESDAWGGFDFSNLNRGMAAMRGTGPGGPEARWAGLLGRATMPYPIFTYKKWNNFYAQVAFAIRDTLKFGDKQAQANGFATLAAFYAAWKVADMAYEATRPKDLPTKDEVPAGEKDIPYPLRKSLRVPIGEAWSNIADVPILGEAAYYRELERGGATVEDVMRSQIGYGILPQALNTMLGLGDPFQPKDISTAGKFGNQVASMLPFNPEANAVRKLQDPNHRDVVRFNDPAATAFMKALANHYPIASEYLPPLVGANKTFPKYDKKEVGMSFFFGNTTFPNEADRTRAITAARIAIMEKVDREFTEDQIRKVLLPLSNLSGDTKSTPLLEAAKEAEMRYSVSRLKMALDMKRTYASTEGNVKATLAIMQEAVARADKSDKAKLANHGVTLLTKLKKSENLDQFTIDFMDAPPEVQAEYQDLLNTPPQGAPQ